MNFIYDFNVQLIGGCCGTTPDHIKYLSSIIDEIIDNERSKEKGKNNSGQHRGIGKSLLKMAEKITHEDGYRRLCIISGVGVRGYYKKQGYHLENNYMVKKLDNGFFQINLTYLLWWSVALIWLCFKISLIYQYHLKWL